MPWIFREETGYFSFCPLTSISFPSLHPLFPSQKPFPSHQHTFFFLPIPLPHPLSTLHHRRDLTSLLTPTQFYRFHILFLVSVLSFLSSELSPPSYTCNLGLSSFILLTHSAVCLWTEDAVCVAPRSAALPSLNRTSSEQPCAHTIPYIKDNGGEILILNCKSSSGFVDMSPDLCSREFDLKYQKNLNPESYIRKHIIMLNFI